MADIKATHISRADRERGPLTPKRVQMTRQKPWRADNPDAVIVARPGYWGNPFRILGSTKEARQEAVDQFRKWLEKSGEGTVFAAAAKAQLRGKDLACWCPLDAPCHADVLLEIANARS